MSPARFSLWHAHGYGIVLHVAHRSICSMVEARTIPCGHIQNPHSERLRNAYCGNQKSTLLQIQLCRNENMYQCHQQTFRFGMRMDMALFCACRISQHLLGCGSPNNSMWTYSKSTFLQHQRMHMCEHDKQPLLQSLFFEMKRFVMGNTIFVRHAYSY